MFTMSRSGLVAFSWAMATEASVVPGAIVAVLIVVWYVAAIFMNLSLVRGAFEREETPYTIADLISGTMSAERPLLPAPHQLLAAFLDSVFGYAPTAPRSLVFHSMVTLSATLFGFVLGALLGVGLALLIVHSRVLEKSLLPWIICSQMVPILALAPGANWLGKTWPIERFSRVAMRLLDPEGPMKGGRLMVLGGPEEQKLAKGLRDVVMRSQFINLTEGADLLTAYACLKRARLFIGNDSGTMHLAAAAGITVPATFILGERDMMTPAKAGKALAAALPNSRTVVLPGAGHMMMTERPDELLAALQG